MTMFATETNQISGAAQAAPMLKQAIDLPVSAPTRKRNPYYLVGEQERSSTKPAAVETGRTLVCVNGRWHGLRGTLATFEQILALSHPDLDRPYQSATVTYRRGSPARPQGSLTPGDVVPIVGGMLINANVTVLS